MKILQLFFLLAVILNFGYAAKILSLFYIPSYSHFIGGHVLSEELARKGHDVTLMHGYLKAPKDVKYKSMYLTGIDVLMEKIRSGGNFGEILEASPLLIAFVMPVFMNKMGLEMSEFILSGDIGKALYSERYDLIIMEEFLADSLKGLCHFYDAPCIGYSSLGSNNILNNYAVGNPAPPSYVVPLFLPYTSRMNFLERAHSALFDVVSSIVNKYYLYKKNVLMHKYFPSAPCIYEVIEKSTAVVLLNSHPSVTQPVPHVPNMIEVGGLHIKPPKKLPEELQKLLDECKEGVIVVSLGSHMKLSMLSQQKRDALVNGLSKLKYKVLWKCDEEHLVPKRDNIILSKWLPQQDVLNHPNVKLFVTHGGLLSTMEAAYLGMPVVGIPIFADQAMNMANAAAEGIGEVVFFQELTADNLYNAIQKVISLKSYKQIAMQRSAFFHDRPQKPLETAVYWIEYVLRHKNSEHFTSAAMKLSWYQYYLLDVLFAIFMMIALPIVIFMKLVRRFRGKCKKCKDAAIKTKKNKAE